MPGCCPIVLRSHCFAHAPRRGRVSVRAGGAAPVVGVFARGWLGFGVCVWVVFAFWRWRFGGVVGRSVSRRHFAPACLVGAHASGVGLLACAGCCVPNGRRAALQGRDMVVPPHTAWRWVASVAPWRGRERRGVWGAPGVLTRAHAQRERRGRGATWGGPWWPGWGLWVVARWVVTRIGGDKYPKPGESKI